MHAAIAFQMASRPAATSSSVRSASSLMRAASAIVSPRSSHAASSSSAFSKRSGYGCDATRAGSPSRRMNPPPIE